MVTERFPVEGTNVRPLVVDEIQIFAGQRYSFVLNADQPVDNYCTFEYMFDFPLSSLRGRRDSCLSRFGEP